MWHIFFVGSYECHRLKDWTIPFNQEHTKSSMLLPGLQFVSILWKTGVALLFHALALWVRIHAEFDSHYISVCVAWCIVEMDLGQSE